MSRMSLVYPFTKEDSLLLTPPFQAPPNWDGRSSLFALGATLSLLLAAALGGGATTTDDKTAAAVLAAIGVGLGALAATRGPWLRRKAEKSYRESVAAMLENTHCRDERVFEYDEEGFTASCRCATLRQPWSRATGFAEVEHFFAITTPAGETILPKHAFPEPSMETEFRAFAHERLQLAPGLAEPTFTMRAEAKDLRAAGRLHFWRGGGWRDHLSANWLRYLWLLGLSVWILCSSFGAGDGVFGVMLVGAMLAYMFLTQLWRARRRQSESPALEVSFGDEGLRLKDWATTCREPWSGYLGYLEDEQTLLLYMAPRHYRLLPKRAMGPQQERLLAIARRHLPLYKRGARRPAKITAPPQ